MHWFQLDADVGAVVDAARFPLRTGHRRASGGETGLMMLARTDGLDIIRPG
jgi:hypothetical protein